MCDCYPGSVLLSVHRDDDFALRALERTFSHDRITTLEGAADRYLDGLNLQHYYFQVDVPPGSEQVRAEDFRRNCIDSLLDSGAEPQTMRRWLLADDFAPLAHPEAVATGSSQPSPGITAALTFTQAHQTYRQLLNMPQSALQPPSFMPTVGVVDSGWKPAPALSPVLLSEQDLTSSPVGWSATDGYGHGSVVLAAIHDLAPDAVFRVYRVGDKSSREWTFLAGLASAADDHCDIINASIGFGLADRNCRSCGRDFGTTRSQVFHRFLSSLLSNDPKLVYVGSAGNQGAGRPCYPARFTEAVCVASTDGGGKLSTFSNRGNYDQDDMPHPCLVLAPGGDRVEGNAGSNEYVASYLGTDWRGTSFAAAYVTGLLADNLTRFGPTTRAALISALRSNSSAAKVPGYSSADHGIGLAQRI